MTIDTIATSEPAAALPPGLLVQLGLDATLVAGLPPDVRDALLDTLLLWGEPSELLALTELLREAHGPLLFLLDYQAAALFALGSPAQAQDVNERRQRRSNTIAAQALEARVLLALGRAEHAQAVAEELVQAYPRAQAAIVAGGEVLGLAGNFGRARELLEGWLAAHAGDPAATLTLARVAHAAGETTLSAEMAERLGPGVSADLPDAQLANLATLLGALGRGQSADAVLLERERRRVQHLDRLAQTLAPYTTLDPALRADSGEIFRRLNGPEAVNLTREESRRVQLEAIRHFGFGTLRSGQTETIACVLRGESVLTVMPTGAGKSLCYQLPALTLPRVSLVISPLIALMKDQVESLPAAARAKATFINSTLSDEEMSARMKGVAEGQYKLVYAAPERLRQRPFLRALRRSGLDLFVIDEAHCVSLWGHDFRPDYLFLQEARRELGSPTTLAMTATAPPRVRDEILDYMREESAPGDAAGEGAERALPRVISLDIFRDNLHLSAIRFNNEDEKLAAVLKFASETEGAGIIYVNTRHKSEALAFALRDAGESAEAYHAGMTNRGEIQDRFMSGKTRIVVATVAFGMGIDKADIRFIVHFHPSRSLAGYYQEVGRAGRDGKPSQGLLLYNNNDWANLRRWAKSDEYDIAFLERVYAAVAAQLRPDPENAQTVRGAVDARRLQQVLGADETAVRVAVSMLERADLLTRGFDIALDAEISLPRRLPAAVRDDPDFADLVRGLALLPGQSGNFRLSVIADLMDWSPADCEGMLLEWEQVGFLTAKPGRRVMSMELPPTPDDLRARLERLLGQSQALSQRRIDDMVGYATAEGCRHGYISAHFGSPPRARCTVCDNCTGIRPNLPAPDDTPHLLPDDTDIVPMILDCLVSLPRPVGRSGLARILAGNLRAPVMPDKARHHGALKGLGEGGVMGYIDDLLENGRLRQYDRQGYQVLAPTIAGRAEADSWLAEHPDLAAYGVAPIPPEGADTPVGAEAEAETYTGLQKALWLWRRRLAEELGQPPYMIMSNALMLQVAERRPRMLEEMAQIPGMGAQRLERFGPAVLDLIALHPAAEGDGELLSAQHIAAGEARSNAPAKRAAVSPRMERQIFMRLQEMRQKAAVASHGKSSEVAANSLLKEIARVAPRTLEELDEVLGFRTSGLRKEGPQIVTYIEALYAREQGDAGG